MLVSTIALLATLLPALASSHGTNSPPHLRHRNLVVRKTQQEAEARAVSVRANEAHAAAHRAIKRTVTKRGQQCRPRKNTDVAAQAVSSDSATAATTASAVPTSDAAAASSIVNQEAWAHKSSQAASATTTAWSESWSDAASSTTDASPSQSTGSEGGDSGSGGGSSGGSSGTLSVTDSTCGWCGSSADQPNGSEDWLNCGVNGGGWTPPHVTKDQLIAAELDASGVFSPCAAYIEKFKSHASEFGVPAIMLASFAMQESTCNAAAVGGNGEAGLMQIAPVNWEAGQDAWDVDYNIRRGAQLFSQMIDANGGNVIAAIGSYNGWQSGMTEGSATAGQYNGNCHSQNNLDYLFQFTNGWMQNKNAYSMGKYFNLAMC